jgi:hypothetical protein
MDLGSNHQLLSINTYVYICTYVLLRYLGKSVVSKEEAYRRIQAAIDARNEGINICMYIRLEL